MDKDTIIEVTQKLTGQCYPHEYSIQNISNRANRYLTALRDMLCDIDYLSPIESIEESEDEE